MRTREAIQVDIDNTQDICSDGGKIELELLLDIREQLEYIWKAISEK